MVVNQNMDVYAPAFRVEIEGKALSPEAIISVSVDEDLEAPGRFTIILNEGLDIKTQAFTWLDNPDLNPGHSVEVYFGYAGRKSERIIRGTIKALSPSFPSTGIPSLTLEGYDPSHGMQKRMSKVNDAEVKYSDVARELATRFYHLNPDGIEDSGKTHKKVERQKGEKDYGFLRRLADQIGFEFFVRGETLHFRKPRDGGDARKTFQFRKDFISFSPRLSMASLVNQVVVSGWNEKQKESIKERVRLKDIAATSELVRFLEKFIEDSDGLEPKIIEDKALNSNDEAKKRAEVELKKAVNTFIQGDLECIGDPELRAGSKIEIGGIGTLFSGSYYVTSTRHTFDDTGYRTTLGVRRIIM